MKLNRSSLSRSLSVGDCHRWSPDAPDGLRHSDHLGTKRIRSHSSATGLNHLLQPIRFFFLLITLAEAFWQKSEIISSNKKSPHSCQDIKKSKSRQQRCLQALPAHLSSRWSGISSRSCQLASGLQPVEMDRLSCELQPPREVTMRWHYSKSGSTLQLIKTLIALFV